MLMAFKDDKSILFKESCRILLFCENIISIIYNSHGVVPTFLACIWLQRDVANSLTAKDF